ncbi:hypothetical protein FQN54_009756 [Arachnomyces sp. PD_36]|nr:hypothetical protein FQN54_009756 [Arachnomyces sp. PD_36]
MTSPKKPTLLYVGRSIQQKSPLWTRIQESCNILVNDLDSDSEMLVAFAPGGKYSNIDGILRPNTSDSYKLPALTKEVIAQLPPSLKIISSANHGYDVEDTDELARRGIWYCNGAGGANDSTADLAVFLIIAAFRFTSYCENELRTTRQGNFYAIEEATFRAAKNPRNHILGVIGMGEVGIATSRRAVSLGMSIHYHGRRRKSPAVEESLGAGPVTYHEELESLLKVADCVLLACPHTPETHHILNKETFGLMKRGVRVINVGRGKCIDEEALADAIDDGIVGGVGLDVYHDEPVVNPRLLDNWRITLTPHMGGGSYDTLTNFERIALENIESYFLGNGKPLTPVNNVNEPPSAQ